MQLDLRETRLHITVGNAFKEPFSSPPPPDRRRGCEADHSPPSRAKVKECVELYFNSPHTLSWRGAQQKTQGQLYLYIYLLFSCLYSLELFGPLSYPQIILQILVLLLEIPSKCI
jgi:hypothetical protein